MTKTIEFIEDRIKIHKISKESALKIIKEFEGIVPVESYKKLVEEDDKNIQILEQIKLELEAWEIVKKHCDYQDGDKFNCIPEGFYIIEPIRGTDFLTVKKALEVENE